MNKTHISRRQFVAGLGAVTAMPYIIPATALGKGRPAPSDRINVGFIGYGTQTHDNIGNFLHDDRVQVVSVADCNRESGLYGYGGERQGGREPGRRHVNGFYAQKLNKPDYDGCKVYTDFRELLDKDALDAVVISTPEHWHALQAVAAARKGIHIYGEKPLALCITEGRAIVDAVKKHNVIFQLGSQQRSEDYFRMASEFIRNGRLGKLQKIEVGLPGGRYLFGKQGADTSKEPLPQPPAYLDFEMWLGPAPKRPYIPAIHTPLSWRDNLDYAGGHITDWGAHHLDIVQWALGKDESGPVAIENLKSDLPPREAVWNTVSDFSFEVVYAEGTRVFASNHFENGIRFIGEGGKELFVARGKLEATPQDLIREKITDSEIKLYVSGNHVRNFINCIYNGEPTIATSEIGYRSNTVAHLANIGLRLGRDKVQWDPAKEEFINDPDATKLKTTPMHNKWSLHA